MSNLEIRNLSKWFEHVPAIRSLNLEVEDGEFLVILGPSGCGKTTTLRCIAGIEEPSSGEIEFGGEYVYSESRGIDVAPKDRDIGLVFQNYALYPHMTVAQNVAFGLKIRKYGKAKTQEAVGEVLSLVGLDGLEDRLPSELSGGQQQRVALARMLVRKPSILLFDEPLSNLDVKLRSFLRAELKSLHKKLNATSLFVTHDQAEAMILGDRIAVMDQGEIAQIGFPDRIYHYPASVTVARFTGRPKTNLIEGVIDQQEDHSTIRPEIDPNAILTLPERVDLASGQRMILHVRPEELDVETEAAQRPFSVYAVQPQGAETLVHLRRLDDIDSAEHELLVRSRNADAARLAFGQKVGLTVHRGNLYSAETELLVTSFSNPVAAQR